VQLAFTVQPSNAMAGVAISPVVAVAIEDASGHPVTSATDLVTVTIATNPGGGTLGGTASVAAVNGVATFLNLQLDKAGTGYTLTAAATGLTGATSAPFDITPAATQLVFTVQPSNPVAGAAFTPAVQVTAQDAAGNPATGFARGVTVAIGANPGGGTLSGMTTVNAVNGVATFNNLSIQKASTGYTLTAAFGTLTGATSAPFAIAPAAPARVSFKVQPSDEPAGVAISPVVAVAIEDAFGNTVTSATSAVTVAINDNPGGGILSGTTTLNAVNGVATFSNLSIQKASTGYTLWASSGSLAGARSAPFAIAPAAPATVSFVVPPSSTDVAQPIAPAVQVAIQDAFANMVTTATNPVTLALGANPGGATLAGTLTVPAVNGVASFANLRLDRRGSGYTLAATSGTLTGATSLPFSVVVPALIAFVNEDQAGSALGIATMHPDGSSVVSLTASGTDYAPAWSPDGAKIAFLRGLPCAPGPSCSHVFTMNADGSGVTDILPGDAGTAPTWIAWKPDGSRIAFTGTYQNTSGLYVMDPDGSHVALVLAGVPRDHPSWSPDGARIAVAGVVEVNVHVYVVNADGTGLARLTSGYADYGPAWKPDGTRIVYVGISGAYTVLNAINPDGSGWTTIVGGASVDFPTWSPDGQRIAFMARGGCDSSACWPDAILVANGDGTGQQVINRAGTLPAWRP
jgi:Tol biopolymer transport system component